MMKIKGIHSVRRGTKPTEVKYESVKMGRCINCKYFLRGPKKGWGVCILSSSTEEGDPINERASAYAESDGLNTARLHVSIWYGCVQWKMKGLI